MTQETTSVNQAMNKAVSNDNPIDRSQFSIEALALLINTQRLKQLEDQIRSEFLELKKRQDEVAFLHKLIKTINTATVDDELDISDNKDLQDLMLKAKSFGVDLKEDKLKYTKEERERLLDNIRITSDDNNVLNDMQLQTITRLTTERYESYQLARSIMKPLHEDKVNKARAMAGR